MIKYDTNIYRLYIYFKCVIVSWSSATGSYYSTEFSVQNGGGNCHVTGATVAMERSIEFRLLVFYTLWYKRVVGCQVEVTNGLKCVYCVR